MRTKIYYLAMIVIGTTLALNSCSNETKLERQIKRAFQEYRDKNLGDNTSSFEITEITSDDTLTNEAPLILIGALYDHSHLLKEEDMEELESIRAAAKNDRGHVIHTIKIRLRKEDGEKVHREILTFFAMEDMKNGEFTVSLRMNEVKKPQYMIDLLNLGNKVVGR